MAGYPSGFNGYEENGQEQSPYRNRQQGYDQRGWSQPGAFVAQGVYHPQQQFVPVQQHGGWMQAPQQIVYTQQQQPCYGYQPLQQGNYGAPRGYMNQDHMSYRGGGMTFGHRGGRGLSPGGMFLSRGGQQQRLPLAQKWMSAGRGLAGYQAYAKWKVENLRETTEKIREFDFGKSDISIAIDKRRKGRCNENILNYIRIMAKEVKDSVDRLQEFQIPRPLQPDETPHGQRVKVITNSFRIKKDDRILQELQKFYVRIYPARNNQEERTISRLINKLTKSDQQDLQTKIGDWFIAGAFIQSLKIYDSKETISYSVRDGRDRVTITLENQGTIKVPDLSPMHKRQIYKQLIQNHLKSLKFSIWRQYWVPTQGDMIWGQTLHTENEIFTDINLHIGYRFDVVDCLTGKQIRISLGTKKVAALTVGEMIKKINQAAAQHKDPAKVEKIRNALVSKHINGQNTILTYDVSTSKNDILVDFTKNEQSLFGLDVLEHNVKHFRSAWLGPLISKAQINWNWLMNLFKDNPRNGLPKVTRVEASDDIVELKFQEWVTREDIQTMNEVFQKAFPNHEQYRKWQQRKSQRPLKNFSLQGYSTTRKNWIENRYKVKVAKQDALLQVYDNKKKKNEYFIPDCCLITGFARAPESIRLEMQEACNLLPTKTDQYVLEFAKKCLKPMATKGIIIEEQIETEGLTLAEPEIKLVQGKIIKMKASEMQDGLKKITGFINNFNMAGLRWGVLFDVEDLGRGFITAFRQLQKDRCWNPKLYPEPKPLMLPKGDLQISAKVETILKDEFMERMKLKLDFLFILLTSTDTPLKNALTRKLEGELEIKTQFCSEGTLAMKDAFAHCIDRMMEKLGAQIYTVSHPELHDHHWLLEDGILTLGLQICHDETASGFPSVAVMTSCGHPYETNMGKYHSTAFFLPPKKDILSRRIMEMFVKEAMEFYYRENKKYPFRVLLLRDSVGKSRFQDCLFSEVEGLRAACKEIASNDTTTPADHEIYIEFLAIAKRHNYRFSPINSGMVIDRDVLGDENWLFLICHHSNAQVTQYDVLVDDWNLQSGEQHVRMLYNLLQTMTCCYTPSRKGVRSPSVLQWASKHSSWLNKLIQPWIADLEQCKFKPTTHRPNLLTIGSQEKLLAKDRQTRNKRGRGRRGRGQGRGRSRGRARRGRYQR